MGQAAGSAAALAVEIQATDMHEIDVQTLRNILKSNGMELDPRRHQAFAQGDTRLEPDDVIPDRSSTAT
jgi:hypothetical protein